MEKILFQDIYWKDRTVSLQWFKSPNLNLYKKIHSAHCEIFWIFPRQKVVPMEKRCTKIATVIKHGAGTLVSLGKIHPLGNVSWEKGS